MNSSRNLSPHEHSLKVAPPPEAVAPARILLIDDDDHFSRSVAVFLRGHGFEVVCAGSGPDGLLEAARQIPDLVVCDLEMPGMDGYEVLARLRQDAHLADVSLMFLTGRAAPEQIRAGMNLGADDYLTKPVDSDELLRAVKARLARAEAGRRQRDQRRAGAVVPDHAQLGLDSTFLVKTTSEKKLIKVREVKSIIAYGEYAWVYWDQGRGALLRKPLKQWEAELPDHQFVRIHRNAIINLAFLDRVEKSASGGQQVRLRETADPIAVSLRLAPVLNRKLKGFRS